MVDITTAVYSTTRLADERWLEKKYFEDVQFEHKLQPTMEKEQDAIAGNHATAHNNCFSTHYKKTDLSHHSTGCTMSPNVENVSMSTEGYSVLISGAHIVKTADDVLGTVMDLRI